ncbi:MAG TPA: hypothetical protein VG650_16885 [Mycobacteriales bacterium]|nr:hypothetical protein [Mycobacteriales bacterium]
MKRLLRAYRGAPDVLCAVLASAGLVIDAVVHLRLASNYDPVGGTISQGALFRVEAVVALAAAAAVLVTPWRRAAYALALLVAASAFGAVMLYRYVNVGSLGPLPNMYEPVWFGQKTLTAYAEAGAALSAAAGLLLGPRRRGSAHT